MKIKMIKFITWTNCFTLQNNGRITIGGMRIIRFAVVMLMDMQLITSVSNCHRDTFVVQVAIRSIRPIKNNEIIRYQRDRFTVNSPNLTHNYPDTKKSQTNAKYFRFFFVCNCQSLRIIFTSFIVYVNASLSSFEQKKSQLNSGEIFTVMK